jgi:hypothetical protein
MNVSTERLITKGCDSRFQSDIIRGKTLFFFLFVGSYMGDNERRVVSARFRNFLKGGRSRNRSNIHPTKKGEETIPAPLVSPVVYISLQISSYNLKLLKDLHKIALLC